MTRTRISYPTGWTLAVLDDADAAAAATSALREAGIGGDDVAVLGRVDDAGTLERLGASHGIAASLRRTMQFITMDQAPDLHVYERAVADGHLVLAIRVADAGARDRAVDILRRHGGHFVNRFGAWATEEIVPWRGPRPEMPQHLMR